LSEVEVVLSPGGRHREPLPGLGPVGYQWEALVEDGEEIVSVAVSYLEPPPGPPVAGRGTDEVAEITARRPGEATVRLRQVRSWEPDKSLGERTLHVTVKDDQ
jgi:predicted secreted protein